MKLEAAMKLLRLGEPIRCKTWSDGCHIRLVDGKIVWYSDDIPDGMDTPSIQMSQLLDEWEEWIDVKTICRATALATVWFGEYTNPDFIGEDAWKKFLQMAKL